MKHVMGVINLVNEPDDLEELTYFRCPASVPFGGRYRLIDFTLSNMVNSGIDNVAVFTQHKYRSLDGSSWVLGKSGIWTGSVGGLFVLPSVLDEPTGISRGDLYQFYSHRDYFYRGKEELVIISRSHMVCNLDLRDAVRYHEDTQADITVIYKQTDEDIQGKFRRLAVKDSGQVTSDGGSHRPIADKQHFNGNVHHEQSVAAGYGRILLSARLRSFGSRWHYEKH